MYIELVIILINISRERKTQRKTKKKNRKNKQRKNTKNDMHGWYDYLYGSKVHYVGWNVSMLFVHITDLLPFYLTINIYKSSLNRFIKHYSIECYDFLYSSFIVYLLYSFNQDSIQQLNILMKILVIRINGLF